MPTATRESDRCLVHVNLTDRSYDVVVGHGILDQVADLAMAWIAERFGSAADPQAFLVTDRNVAPCAGRVAETLRQTGWRVSTYEIEPGEPSKSLEVASRGWDRLVEFQADRRTVVFAIGGGVVGDLAGFIAATFARGLPFIQVPTTLLADVDSSVGGKVGINHPLAKNLIGAFHQPLGVLVDTASLETLPDREYRAGLAEVIKYGVILDAEFFEYLEGHVAELNAREPRTLMHAISRSCELKAAVVQEDEYERTGLRAVLNYGHTFGHAYEALSGYGELLHGEAVAIGMVHASRLAERMGRIDSSLTARQIRWLQAVGLPVELPRRGGLRIDDVIGRMLLDKKTVGGKLRFVLPDRLGHVELVRDVPQELVRKVLHESIGPA